MELTGDKSIPGVYPYLYGPIKLVGVKEAQVILVNSELVKFPMILVCVCGFLT